MPKPRRRMAMCLLAPFAGLSASAFAQDENPQAVDAIGQADIIVTARKRAELLNKIPESIAVLNSEALAKAGVTDLNTLGRQSPNILLNQRQDSEPNVVIRGIGAFGNTQGIGFYIDDVQNRTDQSASIIDVERVEVLKGPQGTLYGGNNIGGAIKLITKKPTDMFGLEARAEYGSFNSVNLFGAINAPIAGAVLTSRVSAYWNESDGFVRNSFLGGHADRSRERGVRAAFRFQPSDKLDALLTLRYNELENGGYIYVRTDGINDYLRTATYNVKTDLDRKVMGVILAINYDLPGMKLTSITSATRRKNYLLTDLDYSSADGIHAFGTNRSKQYTQELRLASDNTSNLDWIVGLYASKFSNPILSQRINIFLGPASGGPRTITNFYNADSSDNQYAAFATANYKLGNVRIGGGVRLNRSVYKANLHNLSLRTSVKDTVVLPKLSVAYDIDQNNMLYISASEGYEPGKINLKTPAPDPYRAEKTLNLEGGYKGKLADGRLSLELTGFRIEYKNRQFESQFLDSQGVVREAITNIGKSTSYGVEGGLTWRVVNDLTIAAGAGWIHSEWDRATLNFVRYDGNKTPNTPNFTANASIDYSHDIGNGYTIGARADINHTGSFYWDIPNLAKQKNYNLVGARISLSSEGGWELSIRAENLFNEHYLNEFVYSIFGPANPDGSCVGCHIAAPGRPRSVMGSLSFKL